MANKKNKGGSGKVMDGASTNPLIRSAKALVETYASSFGKSLANEDVIQAGVDKVRDIVDNALGVGTLDATLRSKIAESVIVGVFQMPWVAPFFAKLLGVDPDLANEVVQEGADNLFRSFLEETSKLAEGKTDDQQKKIFSRELLLLKERLKGHLITRNRAGLEMVWYDPEFVLAHKPGCKTVGNKSTLVKDIMLLDACKRAGRKNVMTNECSCVSRLGDQAGSLDEVLARMNADERDAILNVIASHKESAKILLSGNKRNDVTAAKLGLVLKILDPKLRMVQLFNVLGFEEGKQPSLLEKGKTMLKEAESVLMDPAKRKGFEAHANTAGDAAHSSARRLRDF